MKRKTIDAWHELRLTVVQIGIPACVAAFAIDGRYPDLKYKIRDKFNDKKESIENKVVKFTKKKGE